VKVHAEVAEFWAVVDDCQARIRALNKDGSFAGFASLFSHLVNDLPPDFVEVDIVPPTANEIDHLMAVLRPGPRLNAIAAALRAFDVNEHFPLPQRGEVSASASI
jgi:hypothetical protein